MPRFLARHARRAVGLALVLAGCTTPLAEEPWAFAERGSTGFLGRLGLWADVDVASTYEFDSNFGAFEIVDDNHLDPRFSAALGVEHFVLDDVSLSAGVAFRAFQPDELGDDAIVFDQVDQFEGFLTARWLVPWTFGPKDRLRPFLQLGVGWLPDIDFDATFDLGVPAIPAQDFSFDGSTAWSLGAGTGLVYQLSDHWTTQLGWLYEWNLSPSEDDISLDILGEPLDLDVSLEPEGWVAFIGLTYYL